MSFQLSTSIGYKDIFDDYDKVDVKELIKDIPTDKALAIIGFFLAQLHTKERNSALQLHFLKMWCGRLPNTVHEKINEFIEEVRSKENADYNFLNNVSGLILTEILIENQNALKQDNLTPEQELNLFKAYLHCSQKWIDEQHPGFKSEKIETAEQLIKVILPTQLPFQEVLEFKDFRIQFIKAIYFFRFCEEDPQFKSYLTTFLAEYKLSSWQNYLLHLISLYVRKFEALKTPSVIEVPDKYPDVISFLSELSVDPKTFTRSDDFLGLRERPIYRLNENDFNFLNLNFFVDKIYQGIQFDFGRVLVKNKAQYKGKEIKSTAQFMGIFGEVFSETGLFYSVMDYAFGKSGYIKLKGEQIKKVLPGGEPDYYMRDKGKIYLFEFKNIYLAAGVKHSHNYDVIIAEINKKLVENQNGSPKGVTQLVNVIEKIRSGEFSKVDVFDPSSAIIYPVIVYVDFSFNLAGVNWQLGKEFLRQIAERGIPNAGSINRLILIDIDTFIKFQDLFREKTLKINNCFQEYYEHIRKPDLSDKISTFNMFIHNKTAGMTYGSPKLLMEEILKLLPSENLEGLLL